MTRAQWVSWILPAIALSVFAILLVLVLQQRGQIGASDPEEPSSTGRLADDQSDQRRHHLKGNLEAFSEVHALDEQTKNALYALGYHSLAAIMDADAKVENGEIDCYQYSDSLHRIVEHHRQEAEEILTPCLAESFIRLACVSGRRRCIDYAIADLDVAPLLACPDP